MANEVPGVRVPEAVLERMRRAPDAAAEGIAIARELGQALRTAVHGVHVSVAAGRMQAALEVLEAVR
jgi:homocysteine S-methyltransferase